jgi:hypothetical protein
VLHEALDELITDYLEHHADRRSVRGLRVQDLVAWSATQTKEPTEPPTGTPHHTNSPEAFTPALDERQEP